MKRKTRALDASMMQIPQIFLSPARTLGIAYLGRTYFNLSSPAFRVLLRRRRRLLGKQFNEDEDWETQQWIGGRLSDAKERGSKSVLVEARPRRGKVKRRRSSASSSAVIIKDSSLFVVVNVLIIVIIIIFLFYFIYEEYYYRELRRYIRMLWVIHVHSKCTTLGKRRIDYVFTLFSCQFAIRIPILFFYFFAYLLTTLIGKFRWLRTLSTRQPN